MEPALSEILDLLLGKFVYRGGHRSKFMFVTYRTTLISGICLRWSPLGVGVWGTASLWLEIQYMNIKFHISNFACQISHLLDSAEKRSLSLMPLEVNFSQSIMCICVSWPRICCTILIFNKQRNKGPFSLSCFPLKLLYLQFSIRDLTFNKDFFP